MRPPFFVSSVLGRQKPMWPPKNCSSPAAILDSCLRKNDSEWRLTFPKSAHGEPVEPPTSNQPCLLCGVLRQGQDEHAPLQHADAIAHRRASDGVTQGRFLVQTSGDVTGEVPAILLVQGLVDALGQEVPVAATDDALGDEDYNLTQQTKLFFVADALGLVPPEPVGVVHQQDVEQVHLGVLEKPVELQAFLDASAATKLGVPAVAKGQAVGLGEPLLVAPLYRWTEAVLLVKGRIPYVSFSPETPAASNSLMERTTLTALPKPSSLSCIRLTSAIRVTRRQTSPRSDMLTRTTSGTARLATLCTEPDKKQTS